MRKIDWKYPTVVTPENIEEVHARLSKLLLDCRVSIITTCYADGDRPSTRASVGVRVNSSWTDQGKEQVRLFKKGEIYQPRGEWSKDSPREITESYISFSLGSYLHSININSSGNPEYNHTVRFEEAEEGEWCEWVFMAPAGKGHQVRTIITQQKLPLMPGEDDFLELGRWAEVAEKFRFIEHHQKIGLLTIEAGALQAAGQNKAVA